MEAPFEACQFIDPEDGHCRHPLADPFAGTPECHDDCCPELRQVIHFTDGRDVVVERGPASGEVYLEGHLMPGWATIYGFLKWMEPAWRALGWLPEAEAEPAP